MEQAQLSNKEVSSLFKIMAGLMELHNENPFKAKSYANAAFGIGRLPGRIMEMTETELEQAQGIGKSVAAKIMELRNTGTMQTLDELVAKTPDGVLEMLRIKGLGGKKVAVIWRELGIESAGELLYACYENRLVKLKGFGEKTQQSIIQAIEYYQNNIGKFHFAGLDAMSKELVQLIADKTGEQCLLTGEIRRKCNVQEKIEILISLQNTSKEDLNTSIDFLHNWQWKSEYWYAETQTGIPVHLYPVPAGELYTRLFETTGSVQHVGEVKQKITTWPSGIEKEETIYSAAGLPYIIPEMRDLKITEMQLENIADEKLINTDHIKGVVHNHTTWSDGKHTLQEMTQACIDKGFEYLVISDHSKTAVYAGGLTVQQVLDQHQQIDALNAAVSPFKIFKSIESDILNDGTLDYPDEILRQFDLVIASVHQNLRMDMEKATSRILAAVENPYTTILGHMTGRLLLSRPGYPLDHKKIIDACAANMVAIEINANPYRLDIDYTWIPYALQKGVMISVNPDAHSIEGIGDIYFGVCSARKGGLTTAMTLNALRLEEFEAYLRNRKQKKGIM